MNKRPAQPAAAPAAIRNPHRNRSGRRICFVTGTRAEFGLMESALDALAARPDLAVQIVATGMHLDATRGRTVRQITAAGWRVDATVPWNNGQYSPADMTRATALATARLVDVYQRLAPDIVMVVGDRVEAFAAATAAHLTGHIVAHVHGGDRALGQADDCLRHAITKLSHLHFAATAQSAHRIARLGEDRWRIFNVGSPALDQIDELPAPRSVLQAALSKYGTLSPTDQYALLVLHPQSADDHAEARRARMLLNATRATGFDRIVVIHPNTDPGAAGIVAAWTQAANDARSRDERPQTLFVPSAPREIYLGLLRDAAVLVGNSSSGIIEAASFRTPVLDVGQRQQGRLHSANLVHVPWTAALIRQQLQKIWNGGHPRRSRAHNIYGQGRAATQIADILGRIELGQSLRHKLIAY